MVTKNAAVELQAVHRQAVEVQVLLAGLVHITRVARVLWPFMTVDELRDIPRFLVAQQSGLSERHVAPHERGQSGNAAHAGTPVPGTVAPYGREHHLVSDPHTLTISTVADGATVGVYLFATGVIRLEFRFRHRPVTAAVDVVLVHRCTTRHPGVIRHQGSHLV